jgi:AAA domain-containing protein/DnaB helicase-like protein
MNADSPLPNKTETERAVLGAVLVDERVLRVAEQHLSASDFFVPAHRRIFAEMQRLAKDGQPVELVTLCDALQHDSQVAAVGGAAFVASLGDGAYKDAPVEAWAKSVLKASVLRRAALGGELLVKHALEPGACIENLAVQAAALQETLACQPTQAGGFDLTHLGDLLAKPDTPVDWVLQNTLLAGGVSGVFAKPKVGKSTFCRNLCLAIARGGDFLGFKTKQGECIYVALEEREDDVRNDFRSMGADGSEPIYFHAASAPADGIDALCDLVRQRRPVLVVIDPLFRLARIRDERAYAETYAALGPLIDVAREVGTHVLLCHHAGKGMKSDAVDSPLGSTAIGGAVSTLIILKRNESMRTIQTVQRVGADLPETVLRFEPETHRLNLGGTRFEADRQECEGGVLDFLRDTREPQTQAQIREGVQGKTTAIRAALTELVRSKRVSRTGDGTRGKPFLYAFEDSGSQYIAGTREPECEKGAEARVNTGEILVPRNSQKAILVPENGEQPGTDVLEV